MGRLRNSLLLAQFSAAGFVAERDELASEVVSEMVVVFVHHWCNKFEDLHKFQYQAFFFL
jgi:hypothetical protein